MLALAGLIVLALIILIVAVIGYLAANGFVFSALTQQTVSFGVIVQAIIDICIVAYLALVLPKLANASLADLGFRKPTLAEIGIALAGALVMVIVVNGIGSLIDALLHAKHQQEAIKLFVSVRDPLLKAGFAALAVIIAPIAEEFAFRVFIFNAARRYASFWVAAIISGVFFGSAHLDKYAFLPLVFGGIILCAVYARTRNAWMSMITHGVFNAVSVIALYFAPQLTK